MDYNYNSRQEVPEKYRWDLTKWFKTDEEWYKELENVKKLVNDLNVYKGKIFEKDNLYNILDKYYSFNNRLQKLYVYAYLKNDEDLSVDKYSKMYQEISNVDAIFMKNIAFMMPEILHSPQFDIDKLMKKTPKLERFRHLLEEIYLDKQYIKSTEEEELITVLTKDLNEYSNLSSTMLNSDIDYGTIIDENGKEVTLNTGNIRQFLSSKDREFRKKTYNQFNERRSAFANSIGKNLISFMNRHASIAKIRGYESTKDMDFKNDYIPLKVHEALVINMKKGLPLFREFYKRLTKMLNLDKLKPYDLSAPVVENNKKYSIEEAQKYVYEATSILGKEYSDIIKKGFEERWIDYMPYKGKQSGGYCCSVYGNTSNILLSYTGEFDNISTIAHEMGHAVNAYFSFKHNNVENSEHSLFLAEIPSLLNEILLANYVIKNDFSKEEKISVIIDILKTINANFFTAVMENELEDIVYKKIDNDEAISVEDLNNITENCVKKYYGDTLDSGKYKKYMWMARSHYFVPWYLYKYSTCLCGAVHFATKIIDGDKEVLDKYIKYLCQGNDKFPNDILLDYGIDLTDSKLYDELYDYYNSLLRELDKLID